MAQVVKQHSTKPYILLDNCLSSPENEIRGLQSFLGIWVKAAKLGAVLGWTLHTHLTSLGSDALFAASRRTLRHQRQRTPVQGGKNRAAWVRILPK